MDKQYAIFGRVFDGIGIHEETYVTIKGNIITNVSKEKPGNVEVLDFCGCVITAGFVDLQLNGCGGVQLNDSITEETIETMHITNLQFGCTSFLPTLITTSEENMKKAVEVATIAYKKRPYSVLGIHLEGPYINSIKRGAHDIKYIKKISEDMIKYLCEAVKDIPIVLTLAPEGNDPKDIRALVKGGIIVSMGHTNATYDEALVGINSGIDRATHLFNAMSPFEGRDSGAVGAVINNNIYAGIIVDGLHSDFRAVEIVHKLKGDKLYIVTDAAASMGTDIKEFMMGGQKVFVNNGKCVNESGALAGSHIDMLSSLKNAVNGVNINLVEALKMTTVYPAIAMERNNEIGRIASGQIANIAVFNRDFDHICTIDNGKVI